MANSNQYWTKEYSFYMAPFGENRGLQSRYAQAYFLLCGPPSLPDDASFHFSVPLEE